MPAHARKEGVRKLPASFKSQSFFQVEKLLSTLWRRAILLRAFLGLVSAFCSSASTKGSDSVREMSGTQGAGVGARGSGLDLFVHEDGALLEKNFERRHVTEHEIDRDEEERTGPVSDNLLDVGLCSCQPSLSHGRVWMHVHVACVTS